MVPACTFQCNTIPRRNCSPQVHRLRPVFQFPGHLQHLLCRLNRTKECRQPQRRSKSAPSPRLYAHGPSVLELKPNSSKYVCIVPHQPRGEKVQVVQPRFQSPYLIRLFFLALESFPRDELYFRLVTIHPGVQEGGLNIELPDDEVMLGGISIRTWTDSQDDSTGAALSAPVSASWQFFTTATDCCRQATPPWLYFHSYNNLDGIA